MIAGVEPEKEKLISSIASSLIEGDFLSEESGNCLYMGSGLVQRLSIKLALHKRTYKIQIT
jgi:ABC-type lipoprotein release transport system permease subunit